MVLIQAWRRVVLERYARFDGRADRAEFWWFFLANLIVVVVLLALSRASWLFYVIYVIYAVALIIPGIAVAVRRLHDTNRSGWWVLIEFVPLVGTIILLVFLALAGTPGVNRYGPPALPLSVG